MPRSNSPTKDDARENKLFSRHKWRGKLFSPEKRDEKYSDDQQVKDQDIAHFLGSTGIRDEDRLLDTPRDPRFLSQEKSDAYLNDGGPPSPPPPANIYHRAKPRQNKGLHVDFVTVAPEIIGEGGDEADTPANMVTARRLQLEEPKLLLQSPDEPNTSESLDLPLNSPFGPKSSASDGSYRLQTHPQSRTLRRRSVQDIGDVHPNALQNETSSQDDSPSPVSPISPILGEENVEFGRSQGLTRQDSLLADGLPAAGLRVGNSLTPRVSPEPTSTTLDRQNPTYTDERLPSKEPSPAGGKTKDRSTSSHRSTAVDSHAREQPKSLRKVAKDLGADAIDDFDARVRRFDELFRLGTTVHKDPMDISFRSWLRTATWWFLKGRTELEVDVRNRSRGANTPTDALQPYASISTGLKQAYVDLAKAWWIVKIITPNHPDIRRYGNTSVKSMVAILHNFGNRELADLAQNHVDIVANLRALAMSMKRNGRLPPGDLEIQRLNVKIVPEKIEFPPEVDKAVSSRRQSMRTKIHGSSMPLGDSSKCFAFNRMFGTGTIVSRERSWEPILVPCALSLLRLKVTLDLVALITSQDESLDLLIRAEDTREAKLTWKDVNWSSTGSFISMKLSQDVDFSLQMADVDYRALWTICDYTRKVEKDFQGRRGESLAFETSLESFQCLKTTHHASSFPPEPVSRCSIRLFYVVKAFADGTGRVRAGMRIMAKTPPEIKSLSSISQEYGDDMPTLFGFGQREGTPRLSVRVPGSSTMVLTFSGWELLDTFYSLFTQRQPIEDELRSPLLRLQGLKLWTEDENTKKQTQHLPEVVWQQVRVITHRSPGSIINSPLDRSQHLRLIIQCDSGIMTDCLALGLYSCPCLHQDILLTQSAPGEMQINLSVQNCNEITILRPPQRDLFVSLTDYGLEKDDIDRWRGMIWAAGRSNVKKSYNFRTLEGD